MQTGDEDPFNLTGAPGDYDPNAYFDFGDSHFDDIPPAGDGEAPGFDFTGANAVGDEGGIDWDFNAGADGEMFGTSPAAAQQGGGLAPGRELLGEGRVESVSSAATSPAQTFMDDPGTPRKRQRRSE